MNRYKYLSFSTFVLLTGLVFSLSACGFSENSGSERVDKPNVLLILVDDMGYGDIGSYNPDSKIPTPNIDGLAEEGMRFMDAHAPGAVCHPSRYGLLTGRYPFRTNTNVWPNQPVIEEDRMTVASLLKSQGYNTAMVGKWHLGFDESGTQDRTDYTGNDGNNTSAAYRQYEENHQLSGGPVDVGFDSFFGIRASTDIPPYFYIRDDRVLNPPTDTVEDNFSGGIWTDIQGAFWREGGIAPDLELIDVLPRFTEESIRVIKNHRSSDSNQPLFLYVAFPAPHTPWLPTEDFEGVSGAGMYGDFMAMVDSKIGDILSSLEEENMSEETMVIFASDNGPVWYEEDIQSFGHDSSGGLRGIKGDVHEGGHRIPFIVRWPGVVEPGSVIDQTISFTDVLATFADMRGAELGVNEGEDSFSLLTVLQGEQPEDEAIRPPVVSISSRGVLAIQDKEWKLIDGELGSGGFTQPVYIEGGENDPEGQLYNLIEDPLESTNLWNEHPEIVQKLKNQLREYEQIGRSR